MRAPPGAGLVSRYLVAGLMGAAFAVALYPVWNLEGRWFVVAVVGISLLAVSMAFAGRFSDFLLVCLLFCIPLAGFAKWSFLPEYPQTTQDAALYTGTLGIGISDFILVGLYVAWAGRIFVLREERLPRLTAMDAWVVLLVLACIASLWGARLKLGLFALEHLVKHVLVYLYLSRNFERRHIPWLLGAVAFAISAEGIIGLLQFGGVLPPGLILDKGSGTGDRLEQQYLVPGIEHLNRATGSLYDSHALGTFLAMLAPFTVAFLFRERLGPALRLAILALLLLAVGTAVVTYSRSAWLSLFISLGVTVSVLAAWREKGVVPAVLVTVTLGILTAPWVFMKAFSRLFEAPTELLTARFEQFPIAWILWQKNFLFGIGAGNYMEEMDQQNVNWVLNEPVHNVALFVASETGLFGVVAYYGLVVATALRLWRLARGGVEPDRRIALALLAGLAAYIFDGMSNPIFREPTIYMMFWVGVGVSVALARAAGTPGRMGP